MEAKYIMNKKKVALALAAALGINSLMVTVGTVNGQPVIAHAQEARLTNSEEVKLAEIKTLNTVVESVTQDNSQNDVVTLSFSNLNAADVSSVTVSDNTKKVTGTWKDGKLIVSGLQDGVNTFTVNVTYKDSTSESYEVTLKKTATKDQLTFTPKVSSASITLDSISFGSTSVDGKTVELQKDGKTVGTGTVASTSVTFTGISDMNLNDVYDVILKDGSTTLVKGQFVLVAQTTPEVKSYATQNLEEMKKLESSLQTEYSEKVEIERGKTTGSGEGEYSTDIVFTNDGKSVASIEQTVVGTTSNVGGAKVTAEVNDSKVVFGLDSTAAGVTPSSANFIPNIEIDKINLAADSSEPSTKAYVGEYTVTFSGDKLNTSFSIDTSSVLGNLTVVSATESYFLQTEKAVDNAATTLTGVVDALNTQMNNAVSINFSDLSQGYQSVSVDFTVDENNIGEKTLSALGQELENAVSSAAAARTASAITKINETLEGGTVTTSIIIEADKLEGQAVTGTFKKTGDKTGKLTVSGTGLFESSTNDLSKLVQYVTVDGSSKITYSGTGDANSVTFDVEFTNEVPSTITWSLGKDKKVSNTVKTSAYEPVNATVVVSDNKNSSTGAYLDVTFSGLNIEDGSTVTVEGPNVKSIQTGTVTNNKAQIAVDNFDEDLKSGDYTLKVTPKSNTSETYEVGVQVVKTDIGITIGATSSSNTGVTVTIDAYLNGKDPKTIQSGKIEYREVGATDQTWKSQTLSSSNFKEEAVSVGLTGLTSGKTYEVRVVYSYKADDNTQAVDVYSNTVQVKVATSSNSNNQITGEGGSSTSGTSTGSTTISVTDKNSTYGNGTISVDLPSSLKYNSDKTPVSAGVKYKDANGKVVTENKEQYSGITAKFENGDIVLEGLVPGKDYTEISIDYTDNNGRTKTIVLKNVKVSSGTELQKYLANVYSVVLNREADETGYNFHLNNLNDKKVSLRSFLLNMLTEKEFIEDYKTPETKIEALYNAIVNRSSDAAGRDFWVAEYNKLLSVYGSEEATLQAIADRMVNENELKELSTKLGVEW